MTLQVSISPAAGCSYIANGKTWVPGVAYVTASEADVEALGQVVPEEFLVVLDSDESPVDEAEDAPAEEVATEEAESAAAEVSPFLPETFVDLVPPAEEVPAPEADGPEGEESSTLDARASEGEVAGDWP